MSNIYVGSISFDSGFSSGFQQAPLNISNVHIESLTVTVSTDALIDVSESIIIIEEKNPTVLVSSNALISVSESIILFNPLDTTATTTSNISINVTESIININPLDVTTLVTDNISINVTESIININPLDVTTLITDNVLVNVTQSNIEILPNDVTIIAVISISINTSETILEISSIAITDVITTVGIFVNVSESILLLQPQTPNIIAGIGELVNVNKSDIIVTPNEITTNIGQNINVTKADILILPLIPTITVTSNINVLVDEALINIIPKEAIASTSETFDVYPSNIEVTANVVTTKIGIVTVVNPSSILVKMVEIDGVGEVIPDWDDCLNIDSPYWAKDTDCRDAESKLYDNLNNEIFNKFGVPCVYYEVDYSTANEKVFGEDNDRMIMRNYHVQYYTEQLPQDDKLWSKFGIEGMDTFHVFVSKQHFKQASQLNMNGNIVSKPTKPNAGDIIMSTHNNVYYEVIEVKDKIEMFLQRSHTWDIVVQPNVDKKFNVSPALAGDDINNHINQPDVLGQNGLIDTERNDVLYDDPSGNDPYGLF